jgi:hypothetical protein
MHSATQLGLGGLFRQHTAVTIALGLWLSGFVLAGASAIRMHRAGAMGADYGPPSWAESTPSESSEQADEANGTLVLPMDVIKGHRAARSGVVLMQKP